MWPRVSAWVREEEEVDWESPASDPLPAPVEKACPPGKEAHVVDENLVFYMEWELEACVDGALLAEHMDRVNAIPFTYQQLDILKRKLDQVVPDLGSRLRCQSLSQAPGSGCGPHGQFPRQVYPQGYPESLIQHLSYFFLEVTPEDIHKWNVTSLETVKSLLKVSTGRKMDAQVTTCWEGSTGGWLCRPEGLCLFLPRGVSLGPPTGGCPDCPLSGGRGPAGQGHPGPAGQLSSCLPLLPQSRAAGLRATGCCLVSPWGLLVWRVCCAPSSLLGPTLPPQGGQASGPGRVPSTADGCPLSQGPRRFREHERFCIFCKDQALPG